MPEQPNQQPDQQAPNRSTTARPEPQQGHHRVGERRPSAKPSPPGMQSIHIGGWRFGDDREKLP